MVKFGELEYTPSKRNGVKTVRRTVLLVGYATGFQMWDLDSGAPNLMVSRREGPVRRAKCLTKTALVKLFCCHNTGSILLTVLYQHFE